MGNSKAFSLVELLIVVVIIATLGAIAVPTYNRYKVESRRSEAMGVLPEIYKGQIEFLAENGKYTNSFNDLLVDPLNQNTYYIYNVCNNVGTGNGLKMTGAAPANTSIYACTVANLQIGFTATANGQLDTDAVADNVSIAEKGILCSPDTCNQIDTAIGAVATITYHDDANE